MAKRVLPVPDGLEEITQEELDLVLRHHKLFVLTRGRKGIEASLSGYDLSGLSFERATLDGIDFRGSWLQDCNFNFASLKDCNFENCWVEGSTSFSTRFANANIGGTLWNQE